MESVSAFFGLMRRGVLRLLPVPQDFQDSLIKLHPRNGSRPVFAVENG
jgi:hypothetical protein